jgi:hypothetical protein
MELNWHISLRTGTVGAFGKELAISVIHRSEK